MQKAREALMPYVILPPSGSDLRLTENQQQSTFLSDPLGTE